jgi:hypothetical protein
MVPDNAGPIHPRIGLCNNYHQPRCRDQCGILKKVAVQPTVVEFCGETGGHDYSIEETFRFNVPGPGLLRGMNLHRAGDAIN